MHLKNSKIIVIKIGSSLIVDNFSKNTKFEVITMSTLEKKTVSKIKAKLISYAS